MMTPGEGAGRWVPCEGTFLTKRSDVGSLALRIIIKNGVDRVYVDDVVVEKVQRPALPLLSLPDAVIWPGRPSVLGMEIKSVEATDAWVVVVTTGARYKFEAGGRAVVCSQRIPQQRKVAVCQFDPPLGALRKTRVDKDVCVLQGHRVALSVNGDSLIAIGTNRSICMTITAYLAARHYRLASDNLFAIDETGGFCLYPQQRLDYEASASIFSREPKSVKADGWQAVLQARPRKLVALAVFPPKPFPWKQSFDNRIVHSNGYPADDAIRSWSKHCNVLVLHQNIYRGGSSRGPYVISDDREYRRVISTAQAAGMQVLPYFNPGAYSVQNVDKALNLLHEHHERYKFDSFYFDGLYRNAEWPKSYYFIRRARELVGTKVIYTHSTLNPPANSPSIYCPFIDAYSDFLLRGEGQTIRGGDDPYLRYVVGTNNISNSIATLKGDKMQGVDLKGRLEAMLKLHGRARWPYPGSNKERDDLFRNWYFPTLDRMESSYRDESRSEAETRRKASIGDR
jgi:hypothetical protein